MCQTVADDSVYGILMTRANLCFISSTSLSSAYGRTESTLKNGGALQAETCDFIQSKFEIDFAKSSNHKIQIFVF